jgi:hypothetical protein
MPGKAVDVNGHALVNCGRHAGRWKRPVLLLALALLFSLLAVSGAQAVTLTTLAGPTLTTIPVTVSAPTITTSTVVALPGSSSTSLSPPASPTPAPASGSTPSTGSAPTAASTAASGSTTTATTGSSVTVPSSLGLLPAPVGFVPANTGLSTQNLLLQIWPEYDSTDVLVMMDFTLDASAQLPLTFYFYVPKGARLSGVAEVNEQGQFVYGKTPQTTVGTDFDKVAIQVTTFRHLRLEYYYDPGLGQSVNKSFVVVFAQPLDAVQLLVSVQAPLRSSGFQVQPALGTPTTDAQGFTSTQGSFANVKEGQRLALQISYAKSDAKPSVETSSTTTAGTATTGDSGNSGARWLILLGVIVVVALGGVIAWRLLSPGDKEKPPTPPARNAERRQSATGAGGKPKPPAGGQPGRPARGKGAAPGAAPGAGPSRVKFCTECGTKLSDSDRFCPSCGHKREG